MSGHSFLYLVFRRDIGRKLTALFLALVVYSAVDQQISDTQTVFVRIAYRDRIDPGQATADDWELVVVQRNRPEKPLIVPVELRQEGFRLELSGSKTALEQLNNAPPTLHYYPTQTGLVTVSLDDLEGIEDVRPRLATNGVRMETPLELTFAEVGDRLIPLQRHHIEFEGEPLTGWELPPEEVEDGIVFSPGSLRLSGPVDLLVNIQDGRQKIFYLDVNNKSGRQELRLRLHDMVAEELLQARDVPPVTATVQFVESMVPLNLQVEASINLSVDRWALEPADQQRLDQGQVCAIAEEKPTRRLQIWIPKNRLETEGKDGSLKKYARTRVALHAYARTLLIDRGTVPIYIRKLNDFPSGWDVKFAEGERTEVEIEWRQPTAPAAAPDGTEENSE